MTRDSSLHKETSYYEKVEGLKRRIIDGAKKIPPFLVGEDVHKICEAKIKGPSGQT